MVVREEISNRFWHKVRRRTPVFQNDVLSGVVVISNDNVIPYDVTTKDDMFYQVSCDFSGAAFGDGGRIIVTGGLVVG